MERSTHFFKISLSLLIISLLVRSQINKSKQFFELCPLYQFSQIKMNSKYSYCRNENIFIFHSALEILLLEQTLINRRRMQKILLGGKPLPFQIIEVYGKFPGKLTLTHFVLVTRIFVFIQDKNKRTLKDYTNRKTEVLIRFC